jgi:hypothetical protein
MPEDPNSIPGNQSNPDVPDKIGSANPPAVPPITAGPPVMSPPNPNPHTHQLTSFPVALVVILHYLTCSLFTLIWLNLMHGKMPKVRSDDPSAGKAIGFCFIPFFNLYWIFFTYRRLCLRLDEQRALYGLPPSNLRGMATTNCIFQVIPYINGLIGFTIITPIFLGQVQASVNQLVNTSATTAPRGTLPASTTAPAGIPAWAIALIVCACLICPVLLAGMLLPALARAKAKAERINCVGHLMQIGLAFRIWSDDNSNQFPFNVSTNLRGTFEFCSSGPDGLDRNSWRHFQVMSNELSTPMILVCPSDHTVLRASNFINLQAINVSYLIHSGTNISEMNPQSILAICPIHHNVVFSDGSVHQMTEEQMRQLLSQPAP